MKDLINFALRPKICLENKTTHKNIIVRNIIIFLINLFLTILGSILITFVVAKFDISSNNISQHLQYISILILGLINYLIMPFMEELKYRLFLIFKPVNISITFFIVSFSIISLLNKSSIFEFDRFFLPKFISSILIGISVFLVLNRELRIRDFFEKVWIKYFKYFFYFSVLIFGISHLNKYSLSPGIYFLSPLLIAPQLISGTIWGYVRVKYGIFWSTLHHIIHNLCFYIPLLLLQHFF